MTQEEKQLLLIDLCDRLSYHTMVLMGDGAIEPLISINVDTYICNGLKGLPKPYLRPMSSMTKEEKKEIDEFLGYRKEINVLGDIHCAGWNGDVFVDIDKIYGYLNWLNSHHFDFRGLIEKGLALESPEGMYKTE